MRLVSITLSFTLVLFLLSFVLPLSAQLTTSGGETLVNTTTANSQQNPSVAMDIQGRYVIAWESLAEDGDEYGIYAKVYDAANSVSVSDFLVNATTSDAQRFPEVAIDTAGNFVVVWQSLNQDGDGWGIYFRKYTVSGTSSISETRVNVTTSGSQRQPQVAMQSSGDFVIVWESDTNIYARMYTASGVTKTSEFVVNTTTLGSQIFPSVAVEADDGNFLITWQSLNQDGDGYGIYAQKYDASGATVGSEFRVNTETSQHQLMPNAAIDDLGETVITWASYLQDGSEYGIYAQFYDSSGTARGSEFRVNTTTSSSQHYVDVSATDNGTFIFSWTSFDQDGNYSGVYSAIYDKEQAVVLAENLVNTNTTDYQQFSSVSSNQSSVGSAMVVWQDGLLTGTSANEGDDFGVYSQAYTTNLPFPISWLEFQAHRVSTEAVRLQWSTASESENAGFEVEISENGQVFEKIGFVEGKGNSTSLQGYTFEYFQQNAAFYRLKQVDFDGAFSYSPIRFVQGGENRPLFTLFPNPTSGEVTLDMGNFTGAAHLRMWDAHGKQLTEAFESPTQLNLRINQILPKLPLGIYHIQVSGGGQTLSTPLLKE
ncbi:MAG: T9SS type A sorting domain-containing protein [Bacteroidota bacterium]